MANKQARGPIAAVAAHFQLAMVLAGVLSCIVHLFGGAFSSQHEWFFAGPIALLAMIPFALRPRTLITTTVVWLLALTFAASYFDEQMHRSGQADTLEVLEWLMLLVVLRVFHRKPTPSLA